MSIDRCVSNCLSAHTSSTVCASPLKSRSNILTCSLIMLYIFIYLQFPFTFHVLFHSWGITLRSVDGSSSHAVLTLRLVHPALLPVLTSGVLQCRGNCHARMLQLGAPFPTFNSSSRLHGKNEPGKHTLLSIRSVCCLPYYQGFLDRTYSLTPNWGSLTFPT